MEDLLVYETLRTYSLNGILNSSYRMIYVKSGQLACGVRYLIWEFTESNFSTFIIPNTAFGVLGALASSVLTPGSQDFSPQPWEILSRIPATLFFNWTMTFIFDLSNQRSSASVQEDSLNKPWRPIPTGKITAQQTRAVTLAMVPLSLGLCYALGVWNEGNLILVLTWLYNDLRGGDTLARDLIIAVEFGLFNSASLQIAAGGRAANMGHGENLLSDIGLRWTALISTVIWTTMQVQDLKDQAGDRVRGRMTLPLVLGERVSRLSIAGFVLFWSGVCAYFWQLPLGAYALPAAAGSIVALRILSKWTPEEDAQLGGGGAFGL
ncbi:UbiA prenyltransferase family-domain-containing protein [Pseudomassariella vexata]|uniref:UbiA prenyltransferase family-domain-containing protein n=1 Tax=Pseudomassariella vexata TaxID=1141098 RepID=A0A1Y2E7P6_9PEZI|nr:UbiA prenyltransferase family-domain-containing protein [Pseudomassariella vexata]ORY67581.1 UbiA prenyltransferase family-domain-containing protein [Pseudomassariella vexata]